MSMIGLVALADFEKASNTADYLAERIGRSGRAGASKAEMVVLLKAWQNARHEARNSQDRMLANNRTMLRA